MHWRSLPLTVALLAVAGTALELQAADEFTQVLAVRSLDNVAKTKQDEKTKPEAPDGNEPKNGAEEPKAAAKESGDLFPDCLSVHGQGTIVSQGNWKFLSPYAGANSLPPTSNYRTTETATLYLDTRVWSGADVVFNPEVSGGRGLGRTLGVAGFPNGEATRVGFPEPTPYVARLYFRQTIGFGGEQETVEDGPNQIAGKRDISRITFRVGKFAATDVFDDNSFSHDPRTQFLNWSLMNNGAWDYPANTRGYDFGATIELNLEKWAWRYGIFGEPTEANGSEIDPRVLNAHGQVTELEYRYDIDRQPGKVRCLAYLNNAHMGIYRDAVQQGIVPPDITTTRAYGVKYGFGLNLEQQFDENLGAFARVGWNDGRSESWAFTEIDQTAAAGLLWKGTRWSRPDDRLGVAVVVNGVSGPHRDYLAAGGVGFIIGDGALRYGPEEIVEAFYLLQLRNGIALSFDFQGVNHPGYNRDRGPVAIGALRAHFDY